MESVPVFWTSGWLEPVLQDHRLGDRPVLGV